MTERNIQLVDCQMDENMQRNVEEQVNKAFDLYDTEN